jgi:phage repressor protein C with HTH and peptisase S24 domain
LGKLRLCNFEYGITNVSDGEHSQGMPLRISNVNPPNAAAHLQVRDTMSHSDPAMGGKTLQQILRELLALTGDNQAELARKIEATQPQVSRWLKGTEPRHANVGKILALARHHNIVPSNVYNLTQGQEIIGVDVVGYVGAGGQVAFSEGQGPFEQAPAPPNVTPTMVALRVRGDSMAPMIGDGWLVYYDRHETGQEIAAGKPYVVGLADGRVLVKKLVHGRRAGCYDLYSVNAEPMLDQPVMWMALVKAIIP